jgi:hypothetical protein
VTLANGTDAHHETDVAGRDFDLVGMHDHARIAEGGTLDGVFTRKGGTKEEPAGGRQLALRVEPIRELVGMLKKHFGQAMMSSIEPSQYIFKTVLYFFVRQVQDSL